MRSIKEIFYIGHGPSSSHTIGPYNATKYILGKYPNVFLVKVTLFGSLSSTGKGHLTDYIIAQVLKDIPHEIVFDTKQKVAHPNTMIFEVTLKDGSKKIENIVSIGGGSIRIKGARKLKREELYPHQSLKEIISFCEKNNYRLNEYVLLYEGKEILEYIDRMFDAMQEAVQRGIAATGDLPGELHVKRKAHSMYQNMLDNHKDNDIPTNVAISSFAVSEENASGGLIVVAPTCGSAGVLPGVIKYLQLKEIPYEKIQRGFLVAGLIGMLAKTNASISGAEAGCQAEIGVACAMGAALIATAYGLKNHVIAQCAEVALEHSLGLTCDPVKGYVQIPCIERCAIFALKAINAVSIVELLPSEANKISFDESLSTMYLTGKDLRVGYRETAKKGLAKIFMKNE